MFNKKDVSKRVVSTSTLWLLSIIGMSFFCYFNKDFNFAKLTQVFDLTYSASTVIIYLIPFAVPCCLILSAYKRFKQFQADSNDNIMEDKDENPGE